jgi:hypothetical protein
MQAIHRNERVSTPLKCSLNNLHCPYGGETPTKARIWRTFKENGTECGLMMNSEGHSKQEDVVGCKLVM